MFLERAGFTGNPPSYSMGEWPEIIIFKGAWGATTDQLYANLHREGHSFKVPWHWKQEHWVAVRSMHTYSNGHLVGWGFTSAEKQVASLNERESFDSSLPFSFELQFSLFLVQFTIHSPSTHGPLVANGPIPGTGSPPSVVEDKNPFEP